MAPRGFTNPAPMTASAREAAKSFFCTLCNKGYSRITEFEAHESSYDHSHKKRLRDMKLMQRDPSALEKARKAEQRADERSGLGGLITIKPLGSGGDAKKKGGFKKGGFKSAFANVNDDGGEKKVEKEEEEKVKKVEDVEEDVNFEDGYDYEVYDPRKPTGCDGRCRSEVVGNG